MTRVPLPLRRIFGATALGAVALCRVAVVSGAAPGSSAEAPLGVAPPEVESGSTQFVVAAIGDSLTDFASHGGLYLRYLQEQCPKSRFDGYGKGGDMVNQMRRRFERDVFGAGGAPKYTHVIVFGGVNDLYSDLTAKRTVRKIESDLTAMYDAAHEHGAKVIAITVAPWGGFTRYFTDLRERTTEELNRWILGEAKRGAIEYAVESGPLLACGDPTRLCERYAPPFKDGLHFGPEGHKRLAEALKSAVFRHCQ